MNQRIGLFPLRKVTSPWFDTYFSDISKLSSTSAVGYGSLIVFLIFQVFRPSPLFEGKDTWFFFISACTVVVLATISVLFYTQSTVTRSMKSGFTGGSMLFGQLFLVTYNVWTTRGEGWSSAMHGLRLIVLIILSAFSTFLIYKAFLLEMADTLQD